MRKIKDKKINKKENLRGLLIVITLLAVVISLIGFGFAEQNQFLEDELNNLNQQISDSGYGQFVNYSGGDLYPSVGVYRENDNNLLATFDDIINGKYQIFLTNLGDNESLSTFDLRSFWDVERIGGDIIQKKIRTDEIRRILHEGGFISDI